MTTTSIDFKNSKNLGGKNTSGSNQLAKQLFAVIAGLLLFGLIEVFSASRYQGEQLKGNIYYFGLIHALFVGMSFLTLIVLPAFPSMIWKKLTWVVFLGLLVSLVSVFFFSAENGAHRWIPIGSTGFNVQPSEFAKIGAILLGALLFANAKWDQDKTQGDHLIRLGIMSIPIGIMLTLILVQPDLGNIIVIGGAYAVMYFLTQNKWKARDGIYVVILAAVIGVAAVAMEPYRFERITTHLEFIRTGKVQDEFGKGLQLRNILIGVGSGGLWGKGIGGSQLKYGYFVEVTAFTDSISAVILEELGFLLGSVFIGVYLYLFYLFVKVAELQQTQYQKLVMWGIAMWFIIQTFMHLGANVALIPVKGTTLPFVSYGGSSLLAVAVAGGMAIRLARHPSETA
ncbi:FtsW/RodA/SpoVE family cell cycle protein [bacterium]|nr:FtsW/RodA/SpoVE family cell cycle protein [bacterium]